MVRQFVLAGCISVLALAPALAAPAPLVAPKITQNRDEPGRNFWQAQGSCTTVTFSFCQVTLPAVPTGQRLVIEHVSILNLMPAPNTITSIDIRVLNGQIQAFIPATLNQGISGTYNYTTNEAIYAAFEAGQQPQIITFVSSSANFQMVAIASGYTVTLP